MSERGQYHAADAMAYAATYTVPDTEVARAAIDRARNALHRANQQDGWEVQPAVTPAPMHALNYGTDARAMTNEVINPFVERQAPAVFNDPLARTGIDLNREIDWDTTTARQNVRDPGHDYVTDSMNKIVSAIAYVLYRKETLSPGEYQSVADTDGKTLDEVIGKLLSFV
jgi:hypothetical protein